MKIIKITHHRVANLTKGIQYINQGLKGWQPCNNSNNL